MTPQEIIDEREETHGDFDKKAFFIQGLKNELREGPHWPEMDVGQQEALDMIAVKIGRILYGDPDHKDSWDDIAGYAILGSKS